MLDNLKMTLSFIVMVVDCVHCMSCERHYWRKRVELPRRSTATVAKLAALNRRSCECWVRGGVTQIIRRDDVMTRRRGSAAAAAQGHWLLGVAPPQFSRLYPHWLHHQPATLEADMWAMFYNVLHHQKFIKTSEAGCLITWKLDACLYTVSDFHWREVLI